MCLWYKHPDVGYEHLSRVLGSQKAHLKSAEGALKFFEGALAQAARTDLSEEDRECPICLGEMSSEDVAITACGYVFSNSELEHILF